MICYKNFIELVVLPTDSANHFFLSHCYIKPRVCISKAWGKKGGKKGIKKAKRLLCISKIKGKFRLEQTDTIKLF